jgi:hypothetical protein
MLLTDELIAEIHDFTVAGLAQLVQDIKTIRPDAIGQKMGGGYACFTGEGSPMTQVSQFGYLQTSFDFEEIDAFYAGLATNWELIVTPFDRPELLRRAAAHGYIPDHFEAMLAQSVPSVERIELPETEIVEVKGDLDLWMRTSDAGWSAAEELPDEPSEIAKSMSVGSRTRRYLAFVGGVPAATAALVSDGKRSLLAGASTRKQFRERGLQRALTARRLADAGRGSLLMFEAIPGTTSYRNAQRSGFELLYSKLVMFRKP